MKGCLHYIAVDMDDATHERCGLWFTVAYGFMVTQVEDRLADEWLLDEIEEAWS